MRPALDDPAYHLWAETSGGQETHLARDVGGFQRGFGRPHPVAAKPNRARALQFAGAQYLSGLGVKLQTVLCQFSLYPAVAEAGGTGVYTRFDESLGAEQALGLQGVEQRVDLVCLRPGPQRLRPWRRAGRLTARTAQQLVTQFAAAVFSKGQSL